jgi:hypothetical protein
LDVVVGGGVEADVDAAAGLGDVAGVTQYRERVEGVELGCMGDAASAANYFSYCS